MESRICYVTLGEFLQQVKDPLPEKGTRVFIRFHSGDFFSFIRLIRRETKRGAPVFEYKYCHSSGGVVPVEEIGFFRLWEEALDSSSEITGITLQRGSAGFSIIINVKA